MKTKKIGVIGVDAGICWLGDPCYVFHAEEPPKAIGKTWGEFCKLLGNGRTKQFNYDHGGAGLGVCCSTGYGDGLYPVFAEFNSEGRVARVYVDFMADAEIED